MQRNMVGGNRRRPSGRWAVDSSFLPVWQTGGEWQPVKREQKGWGKNGH